MNMFFRSLISLALTFAFSVSAEELHQTCNIKFNSMRTDKDAGYARCLEKNVDNTINEYILSTDTMKRGKEKGDDLRIEDHTMICLHKELCKKVDFAGYIFNEQLATALEVDRTSKFANNWRCTCEGRKVE